MSSFDLSTWQTSFFDLSTCGTSTDVVLGVICAIALAVSFIGYRLYRTALVFLAFLYAAGIEGAVGSAWIARSPENQAAKILIIATFCVLWGLMGTWICKKMADRLNKFLGFLLGAAVGAALVAGFVQVIISRTRGHLKDSGYLGWDEFAIFTVGVPVAILAGYMSMDSVKYFLMLASAVLGAYIAVRSFTRIMVCAHVAPETMRNPAVNVVAVVLIAVLGTITQIFTQPKDEKEVTLTIDSVATRV